MTNSFRIQWQDSNGNQSGSFAGRSERHDDWNSLGDFDLHENTSYDFHLSVGDGLGYTTFVTLTIDGQTFGAKVPPGVHDDLGDGNDDSVPLGPLALGTSHVSVEAYVLVSEDPKVQVTWGKGTSNPTVQLIWNGGSIGWTDASGNPVGDTLAIESFNQVTFEVTDQSTNASEVAIYQSERLVGELTSAGYAYASTTVRQPTGASTTTYTINVFDPLQDAGRIAVN
jgi:hypothetical protein